jgi:filamentous hemagglutinin family protein
MIRLHLLLVLNTTVNASFLAGKRFGERSNAKNLCWNINVWQSNVAVLLGWVSAIATFINPSFAQSNIAPDNTLGTVESSQVINNFNGAPNEAIAGGAQRGQHLFHSFREFNVSENRGAYFLVPNTNIQNIFARVTGSNPSEIFGVLGTRQANNFTPSTANLFLMNPNGVVFGPNARLDVGGSFLATTANAIQFGEQGFYNANGGQLADVLTINPSAFLFNQISRGNITNRSVAPAGQNLIGENITGLRVPDGKSLLLLGGNVNIEGGGLRAYEGRVELAGLAAPGAVGLNVAGNTLSFNVPNAVERGDISLTNGAEINVRGAGPGDIAMTARDVNIASGSIVRAGIDNALGTPESKSGDVLINATGKMTLADTDTRISNVLDEGSFGTAGNINITTGTFSISNNAVLTADTFGRGNAGNIFLQSSDAVSINSGAVIDSSSQRGAVGNGGNINIIANSLSLTEDGSLDVNTYSNGNAGNVFVRVSDSVSLANSFISSNVEPGAVGNGGDINIEAGSLFLKDGAQLQTSIIRANDNFPAGRGNGGNVNINVRGTVNITGIRNEIPSGIVSFLGTGTSGKGGNITINADSFSLTDNARLNASTFGNGNAGNIFIRVNNSASFVNGDIFNGVAAGAVGNGGDINIQAASLSLTANAQLQTLIQAAGNNLPPGRGNGGNININVRDKVIFAQPQEAGMLNGIQASVGEGAIGKGGDVTINAGSVEIRDGSEIQASTRGKGNSGTITINARDTISFDGKDATERGFSRAINSVQPVAEGNAGGINITTGSLSLTNGAFLSSSTNSNGNAGDITINARDAINLDGVANIYNDVFNLGNGKAGNTRITTGSLSLRNGSQITADVSGKGEAGNITVEARDNVILDGTLGLSPSAIQSGLIANAEGKSGNIQITTGSVSVSNGANISTNTDGKGNAGSITINARNTATFVGFGGDSAFPSLASSTVTSNATGNGGDIRVTARELFLKNGGELNASSFGNGGSGNIFIDVKDAVNIDGVGGRNFSTSGVLSLMSGTTGKGGDIQITTGSLSATNGGLLATLGQGDVGDIIINARDKVKFDGVVNGLGSSASSMLLRGTTGKGGNIQITAESFSVSNGANINSSTSGKGDGGNITINVRDNISLINNAIINASTSGQGNGGNITINAGNTVTLEPTNSNGNASSYVSSIVFAGATGKGGDLQLTAKKLSLNNNALFFNSTLGTGDAGNIFLRVSEDISLNNSSFIDSSVFPGGVGKGGNLDIETKNLTLTNGSVISAAVLRSAGLGDTLLPGARGQGGSIRINASDSVTFSGISSTGFSSAISTLTERGASGDAGDITLTTRNFRATDGAVFSAATFNASKGGDITINADIFELFNGAQVLTNTRDSGNAGNIRLNIKDRITIAGREQNFNQRLDLVRERLNREGSTDQLTDVVTNEGPPSGLFANSAPGSTGNSGSIIIDPRQIMVKDGGRISVNSEGTGTTGNIFIQGDNLILENDGAITARAASRNGGDISLNLANLLVLRGNSQISTTAGTAGAGGDGGNININSKFIVAVPKENSDITANAFKGNSGIVQINTQGIFGIEFRPQETSASDITASGVANINSPDNGFIPNNLTELNKDVIDTNALIAKSCIARDRKSGSFFIQGPGGLPVRPGDTPLAAYPTGSVSNISETTESVKSPNSSNLPWKIGDPIVEPEGMYQLPDGKIIMSNECP